VPRQPVNSNLGAKHKYMKINSARESIFQLKKSLPEVFSATEIIYAFGESRPNIGDDSNEEFRGCLGGNDIGEESGLYIFSSENDEIIYIGKATKDNLHERVWDHLGTPKRLENGWMTFPKTKFNSRESLELTTSIINGNIKLHVFTVSDPDVVSVIEVYLQVMHLKEFGRLPVFNKQIG